MRGGLPRTGDRPPPRALRSADRRRQAGSLRGGEFPGRGRVKVCGSRMVHDDRRRGLLGNYLERRRQRHADLRRGVQEREDDLVLLEIGTGTIAPRVPLAALVLEMQLAPNPSVRVFRERFGRLYGEAVKKIRLAVLSGRV